MSSICELENWDPMAEDYSCPKFNTYNDTSSSYLYDTTGLYVKNIPADLTEETFILMMTEGGRKLKRHHLYPAKPNMSATCGLVSFTSEAYALDAMQSLNRKPPLNLCIQYAIKKKDYRSTLRDNNATPAASDLSQSQSILHKTERGQALHAHTDPVNISNLKVVLDGGKRTTYHTTVGDISDKKQDEFQLPALISNPFLLCLCCKKVAQHSCGICQQPYCSQKCQEEDWPRHKAVCLLFDKDPVKKGSIPSQSMSNFGNDSSYMSEGSSCSDNDKNSEFTQTSNIINKSGTNIPLMQNSKLITSATSHSRERTTSFQKKSPKYEVNCQKKLAFINANEIEETSLPQKPNVKVHVCSIKSPSCFWVQLKTANRLLVEMEKEMSTSVQEKAGPCTANNVCCMYQNGRLNRVQILETMPSTSVVRFIDYGGTSTVQNDQLFHLPEVFKKYPAQAICCNLVDSSKDRNIQWSEEEISSFHCFAFDNTYSAYVHECSNKVYDVSLFNDEGVSVFTMVSLSNLQTDVQVSTPKCLEIPSVWTNLKKGMEVTVAAVEFENDKFWGLLDDSTDLSGTMKDIEDLLVNLDSPDIGISCEEGDVAVGLSPKFLLHYRCIVLKRLRNSFLVHYIDYGNKEEVTSLCSLPSSLLQKKSYVVCCTKPDSLSDEEFKKLFESGASGCVKAVKSSFAELTFQVNAKTLTLNCFPWHHGIISKSLSKTQCMKDHRSSKSSSPIPVNFPIQLPKKILKDAIVDKNVHPGVKYDVKIVYIKTSSEMYVQLMSDEKELFLFSQKLNQYCNSKNCKNKYVPIKDEIVCCKFSEDGNWYRGQVLAKSVNNFRVLFIDFGNEENVSDVDIKPLPEEFVCSKFSVSVSLFNIKNEDISKELLSKLINELWVMEIKACDKSSVQVMLFQGQKSLVDLIKRNNKSSLTFQKLPVGQSVDVQICYADENRIYLHQQKDIKSIENLCDKINTVEKAATSKVVLNNVYCGLFSDGLWYRVCVERELSSSTFMVNFIDFGNKEKISSKDLKELSDDIFAYPVFCVPVIATNFDATMCHLQKTCTVEVIGEKNNVQEVKFCNLSKVLKHPVLSSFQKLNLENGINEIVFCHLENDTYYCHLNSCIHKLAIMSENLQTCSKQNITSGVTSVGDVLCAKSIDGCWYRVSVESINDKDSTYKILFIDYGNTEIVTSDGVMLLPDHFNKIPIFAIPVRVSNLNKVKKIALNSVVSVKTAGFSTCNIQLVELLIPKTDVPKITMLKKQVLPRDKEVNISICYAEGDIFYSHMKSAHELIKALESKLLKATEFSDIRHLPEVGDILCAKFTDGIWYRGLVEEICDDKSCKISFVDYGNSEVISIENMKVLPLSLCSFPVFSISIKIKNIEVLQEQLAAELAMFMVKVVDVIENVHIVEVLKPESAMELSTLPSQILPLTPVEVVVCHKEERLFFVQKCSDLEKLTEIMSDLQALESRKNISHTPQIGELLCVKFQDGLLYRGMIKEKCNKDACKVFFVDFGNTDIVNVSDMFILPSKYLTSPRFCIPIELRQSILTNPLMIECQYSVKYTGKMHDDFHIIDVCPTSVPLFSSLKASSLPDSSVEVCFLSFDGEFYFVSKSSDVNELNKMEAMLENFNGKKILHVASVGEVLLVKCKDKIWRRGCVKESIESLGCYKMFLVDLGTIEDVFACDVCYMSEKFSSFPIFSLRVKVDSAKSPISLGMCYDVCVINKTKENVPIVKRIQHYMFASLNRQFLPLHESIGVIFFHKEQDTMFLQNINDIKLLAEIQAEVSTCAAFEALSYNPIDGELLCAQSSIDSSWYRGSVIETISCDKYKIHFIDYGNYEVISKESLRPFTDKLMNYPSLSIAAKIKESSTEEEVVLEKLYTVIAESEPCDNVQLVKLEKQNVSADLVKHSNETCSVSLDNENSDSSSKFYFTNCKYVPFSSGEQEVVIYHIGESCYVFCASFDQGNVTSNVRLTSEITEFCNNLNCTQYNGSSSPEIHEMVLAKYEEDKQWYRAVVVDKTPPFYDVIFVDYGNSEQLHEDSLRRMEQQFMYLDVQAHLCLLTGFIVDEENLPAVIKELKNFTMLPLKAVVNTSGEDMTVCISSITDHLIEKKLVTCLN